MRLRRPRSFNTRCGSSTSIIYHVAENLMKAAKAIFGRDEVGADRWHKRIRGRLLREPNGADSAIRSMRRYRKALCEGSEACASCTTRSNTSAITATAGATSTSLLWGYLSAAGGRVSGQEYRPGTIEAKRYALVLRRRSARAESPHIHQVEQMGRDVGHHHVGRVSCPDSNLHPSCLGLAIVISLTTQRVHLMIC